MFCAEDGCGRELATGFPKGQDCPSCGGRSRRYEVGLNSTLTMRATLETTRRFYVRHPGWILAQLGLVLVSLIVGIAGFFFNALALIGILVGVGLALLGVFVVPGWRDRVEERRLNN